METKIGMLGRTCIYHEVPDGKYLIGMLWRTCIYHEVPDGKYLIARTSYSTIKKIMVKTL